MRVMALDVGTKRIGVAVSDESATIAQGIGVITRRGDLQAAREVIAKAGERGAGVIVVGLPLMMDGTEGERAVDCRSFAEKLKELAPSQVEVVMWDERLSTSEAESVMLEADLSRRKRKKNIDKLAAQLILQSYLDARKARDG
jgi:putative Holliday junction resolvase